MIVATLLASALLAQQTSVRPGPLRAGAPLPTAAQAMFNAPSVPDLAALHAEMAVGPVDPAWTAMTERGLTSAYEQAAAPADLNYWMSVALPRSVKCWASPVRTSHGAKFHSS